MYQREEGRAEVNNEKQGLNVLGKEQFVSNLRILKYQYFN